MADYLWSKEYQVASLLELDQKVSDLTHELEVQKLLNHILFSTILEGMNVLSPNQNVYMVFNQVLEELKVKISGVSSIGDEAIEEALKKLRKS